MRYVSTRAKEGTPVKIAKTQPDSTTIDWLIDRCLLFQLQMLPTMPQPLKIKDVIKNRDRIIVRKNVWGVKIPIR
jgi:hypothetical protein